MKLKLTKEAKKAIKTGEPLEGIGSSEGFWYDLNEGGYFTPEDVLVDEDQIKQVKAAIYLLNQLEDIYRDVTGEF